MPICLLSLCILRPPLSVDSRGSAKCSNIQGSFHVPVTLLELLYGYREAAFPLASPFKCCSLCCVVAGSFTVCLSLCIFDQVRFMSVCACVCVCTHGCMKAAVTGVPAFSDMSTCVFTRSYSVHTRVCIRYARCVVLRPTHPHSQACLCQHI